MPPTPELPAHISTRAHRLLVDSTTEEIVRAFRSASIRSILLKGPSIAHWLYDSQETRSYSDTDLLVAPADVGRAEGVLARSGFVFSDPPVIPGDRPRHANAWTREADGAAVDLHRSIIGSGVRPERLWEVLSTRTESMTLRKLDVEVLDIPARCVQVALHAAHHGKEVPHPIADLERAVLVADTDVWREAADLAGELDALGAFCQGLSLIPAGRGVLDRLLLGTTPSVEAVLRVDGTPGALGLHWLVEERSMLKRAELLIRKAVPPADYIRDWWPAARGSTGHLLLGYLHRLAFLARQLMPATKALRNARHRVDDCRGDDRGTRE